MQWTRQAWSYLFLAFPKKWKVTSKIIKKIDISGKIDPISNWIELLFSCGDHCIEAKPVAQPVNQGFGHI